MMPRSPDNISATHSPYRQFHQLHLLATWDCPWCRAHCKHRRHIFPYRQLHPLHLLETWDCPWCHAPCKHRRHIFPLLAASSITFAWNLRLSMVPRSLPTSAPRIPLSAASSTTLACCPRCRTHLPTSAPHITLSADSPTTFAWYLRLSMKPRSLSRLKRWKWAISANISATYSPICSFINYICLLPQTVHDAALPANISATHSPIGNFINYIWLYLRQSMMPRSPANISATFSPISSFANYTCLLPETVHDATLPCQHQRNIFPYQQLCQLHLLATWDCPWCRAPLPTSAPHFPLSAASSTTTDCYLRLSIRVQWFSQLGGIHLQNGAK